MFSFQSMLRSQKNIRKAPLYILGFLRGFILRGWRYPLPKIAINLPGPMRDYTVKENSICSAVSEILRYRQTNKHTYRQKSFHFIIRIHISYPRISFDIWNAIGPYQKSVLKVIQYFGMTVEIQPRFVCHYPVILLAKNDFGDVVKYFLPTCIVWQAQGHLG